MSNFFKNAQTHVKEVSQLDEVMRAFIADLNEYMEKTRDEVNTFACTEYFGEGFTEEQRASLDCILLKGATNGLVEVNGKVEGTFKITSVDGLPNVTFDFDVKK
jgi:site-specific DNA-adenine methylase